MNTVLKITNKPQQGFSLIELMISVAIIGIIAAIAYPSYQGFIASTNRGAAQADLMSLAAAMERHKAASFTYKGAAESSADTGNPAIFHKHSPSAELYANRKYDLYISESSGSAFLIEAKPVSSSSQAGDGNVAYYSDGRRAWDANNNGTYGSSEFCWSC
ncbi:type IV pilin protein [Paraglaciecola arctica]|uniref:type IV pilin protein n=1 Tax=Paraglaciecola arctica TaxID=1128911 RepID=UPI001C06BD74|nr:type IV pilin protein [Paraglaciecola arctica]MBU3003630.1 prepilin-type N-terminal cleavage/methylation domain-containing protein [Paraglaciecola arctica]